jgi:hypothetical protein
VGAMFKSHCKDTYYTSGAKVAVGVGMRHKETWGLCLLVIADALSTYWLITQGYATEFNPLMNWLIQLSWGAFFGSSSRLWRWRWDLRSGIGGTTRSLYAVGCVQARWRT